ERLVEARPVPEQADWFDFKKKHYDVIVIGDISAKRFCGGRPEVFRDLLDMVKDKGTGLMMLGGYETFGNSDWQNYPAMAKLLPVELSKGGQIKEPVLVKPTAAGKAHYLLRLGGPELWDEKFEPLDGMVKLGVPVPGATVLARKGDAETGTPVLVGQQFGE